MSKHQTRSQRSASRARHAASIIRDVSGGMSWTIEVGYVDDDRQVAASNVVQAENLFPELIATLPVTREAVIAVARAGVLGKNDLCGPDVQVGADGKPGPWRIGAYARVWEIADDGRATKVWDAADDAGPEFAGWLGKHPKPGTGALHGLS